MSLVINRTNAVLSIDRVSSKLEIQTQNARLELHQKQAKLNIHTELPQIQIDQYECFASAGLKNNLDLTIEQVQLARQGVMEFVAKTADDGNRLASIEKGGNPIVDIVKRDAYPKHEFGMVTMPKVGPQISVKGSIEFDPERNSEGTNIGVDGEFFEGKVDINYLPEKINIYLKQYPSISVQYRAGNNIDFTI